MAFSGDASVKKQLREYRRRSLRRVSKKLKRCASKHSTSTSIQEDDTLYLVEDIIGEKMLKGRKYYKVRWQGFAPEEDSWEPASNLSNVRDIIDAFRRQNKQAESRKEEAPKDCTTTQSASPASVPTPPATPQSSIKVTLLRQRGGSEEPTMNGQKHTMRSRIRGRYEYVPKHQLVASKTKYFDDIRDGKIDLSSNDLYSRVKTRRRLTEASSDSQTSLISANNDSNNNNSTELNSAMLPEQGIFNTSFALNLDAGSSNYNPSSPFPVKREPHSPSSECFHTAGSMSESHSLVDSMDVEQPKLIFTIGCSDLDHITPSGSAPNLRLTEEALCFVSKQLTESVSSPVLSTCDQYVQCDFQHPIIPSPPRPLTPVRDKTCVDVSLSPIHEHVTDSNRNTATTNPISQTPVVTESRLNEELNHPNIPVQPIDPPRPSPVVVSDFFSSPRNASVASIRDLVKIYVKLIAQSTVSGASQSLTTEQGGHFSFPHQIRTLEELPRLEPYCRSARINNPTQLFAAIQHNQWILLADVPTKKAPKRTIDGFPVSDSSAEQNEVDWTNLIDQASHSPVGTPNIVDICKALIFQTAGRPVVLDRLISHGLDPNTILDTRGESLLSLSLKLHRPHIIQTLLDAGAKPDTIVPGYENRTILGMAIAEGSYDLVGLLLDAGANFYQVERGISALSFIRSILGIQSNSVSPPKAHPVNSVEFRNKVKNILYPSPPMPLPDPPPGIMLAKLPSSLLLNASLNTPSTRLTSSSSTTASTSRTTESNPPLPQRLQTIHDLIGLHHAHLAVKVSGVLKTWLFRAGLLQVSVVSPCQWINVANRSARITFKWPPPSNIPPVTDPNGTICPLLILVHGRMTPPMNYDMWIDDEGPCLIKRVLLDRCVEQKPLGRVPFVTTLHPLPGYTEVAQDHEVHVDFLQDAGVTRRPTCIAPSIIAVRLHPISSGVQSANDAKLSRNPPFRSPSSHPKGNVNSPNPVRRCLS